MIEVVISYEDLINCDNQEKLILQRLRDKGAEIGKGQIVTFDNDMMARKIVQWTPSSLVKHYSSRETIDGAAIISICEYCGGTVLETQAYEGEGIFAVHTKCLEELK